MGSVRFCLRGALCVALLVSACAREELVDANPCAAISPGAVVITEVHANPDGSDGKSEYVELFNSSGDVLSLDGLELTASRLDGTGSKTHRLFGASIGAGDYFIVGNAAPDAIPAHVDYSYGDALGSLRNSSARLELRCGEQRIDEVRYERSTDGRALELDGRFAPDHELNDALENWCATPEGVDAASPGNFGTPGASNSRCFVDVPVGGCLDGDTRRAIEHPRPEDLRLTEWMPNPVGPDPELEWVEVSVDADVDLNGLQLGSSLESLEAVVDDETCFPVDAGSRVVFGASPGAAPRVDAELGLSLGNSGARSIVVAVEGELLDQVEYEGATEGVSWQVDASGNVCLSPEQDEYLDANFGTPGEVNPPCALELEPGTCLDAGVPRAILSPSIDEATISEWMADPTSVENRDGEWVEVRFDIEADLNGLTISDLTGKESRFESETCVNVAAGEHIVFARNADPMRNGGLGRVDAPLSISLNNGGDTIYLSVGEQLLDTVAYTETKSGAAVQIDAFGVACGATDAYGDGDLGTPGAANPPCG